MQRELDSVEVLLDLWAEWMRSPEQLAADYPSTAAGGWIASWRKDSEEMVEAADMETIAKVNAAYDSLMPLYKDVINKHYKLGSDVWRFAKPATWEQAKSAVRVYFVRRGLV